MAELIDVVARLVVGAAFVVAGASKLVVGDDWLRQAADLGAPRAVALPLPWIEIVLGAVLVVGFVEPVALAVAAVLLVAFTVLLVANFRSGRRPPCACFGAWSASPIGWRHVARNLTLLALTALALTFS